jgi:type I restriction enzyme R subunit
MESEAAARKRQADPKLAAAGWSVVPHRLDSAATLLSRSAVEEWPPPAGPADYALTDDRGVGGVVDAKKTTVNPQGVLTQIPNVFRRELGSSGASSSEGGRA